MSNLSAERYRKKVSGPVPDVLQLGVDGSAAKIWEGAMVSALTTGFAVNAAATGAGYVLGVARQTVDNSANVTDGTLSIELEQGCFWMANHGSDSLTVADLLRPCYASDNQTVARTSSGFTRKIAGQVLAVDSSLGVLVAISAVTNEALSSKENASHRFNINDWREVTSGGDEGNIAANGGILASDTTPILRGDAAESAEISWATGNADIIGTSIMLPADFDGSVDALLELSVYSGATDAATFGVETSWDGGTVVVDSADDAATKSATAHTISATIAAADVPDGAVRVTIELTPPAHAADTIQLLGARLTYRRK